MTGTVTGLRTDPKDPSVLTAAIVRCADNTDQEVPATLVIGMLSPHFSRNSRSAYLYDDIDCTGNTQAGLKWIRRLASEQENAEKLQKLVPSYALPWNKLRVTYSCGQRGRIFRFFVPPEARKHISIPGGYEKNVWPYTYMPIPGKEHLFYIINRYEGHYGAR